MAVRIVSGPISIVLAASLVWVAETSEEGGGPYASGTFEGTRFRSIGPADAAPMKYWLLCFGFTAIEPTRPEKIKGELCGALEVRPAR